MFLETFDSYATTESKVVGVPALGPCALGMNLLDFSKETAEPDLMILSLFVLYYRKKVYE